MNAWQIKALMEWYKMLERSAKATEQGAEFDPELGVWTDPRKTHQYPFDTVHDEYRLPRPEALRVLRGQHKTSRYASKASIKRLEDAILRRYKGKGGDILWKGDIDHLTAEEFKNIPSHIREAAEQKISIRNMVTKREILEKKAAAGDKEAQEAIAHEIEFEKEDEAFDRERNPLDYDNPYVDQSILEYRAMGDWQKFLQTPLGRKFTERKNRGMSFDKNMALSRKEIERSEQLERDYGHLIPKETDIGKLSALERYDAKIRERVLKDRAKWEADRAFNLPYEQERDRRYEVEGQPHLLQEQLVSTLAKADEPLPRTGKELEVRPPQAPVTRYPGTLSGYTTPKTTVPSSYAIPQRGIEPPDIHVDPSGQARIVSDYYDSIVNYRKSKTGEVAKYMESFDPVEQARRLEGAEQATPARYLTPTPEQKFQTTDTQKRAAHLRKALADLKNRRRRHQGRTGLPFNPKIWDRNMLPTGGPIQRQLERRKF